MGATCKFREKERDKDILSQDSQSYLPNQSSNSENKLYLKDKMHSESKKSMNATNSPVAMERPHFFIIYPKNEHQRNDLIQLQQKQY